MSAVPGLRNLFEEYRKSEGAKRAPQMLMHVYIAKEDVFTYTAGSVFKSITDFSDPTSAYFSSEVENDQSVLFGKPEVEDGGLSKLWQEDKYFRMPTKEGPDQIRFKLQQTGTTIMLYPNEVQ